MRNELETRVGYRRIVLIALGRLVRVLREHGNELRRALALTAETVCDVVPTRRVRWAHVHRATVNRAMHGGVG